MSFSIEQRIAFDRFLLGENLFITGPGGTGKTFLIKEIVRSMKERGIVYQVCAMTGCAAVLLGDGTKTLHSWCGMGLANGHKDAICHKIVHNKKTKGALKKVIILIVDEVSMLSKRIFEALDDAMKSLRKSDAPFGGVQIIFTGDFFQLPPVGNDEESSRFCFESINWLQVFPWKNHIELKHIFRQEDDIYKKVLNQVRRGELDSESVTILQTCLKKVIQEGDIPPTKLFAVRSKTDFVNTRMYDKLEGEERVFKLEVKHDLTTYVESGKPLGLTDIRRCNILCLTEKLSEAERLANHMNRVSELKLKRGTRVMCLHNLCVEDGICNGSQGIVIDFIGIGGGAPIVLFTNGIKRVIDPVWVQSEEYPCIGVGQIPLCLAWALTIHKIQGATLSIAEMDLGNSVFEYGQTYVALSRIRSLDGLYLSAFQPKRIKANPIVKEFYDQIPLILETSVIQIEPSQQIGVDELVVVPCKKDNIFSKFECSPSEIREPDVKIIRL